MEEKNKLLYTSNFKKIKLKKFITKIVLTIALPIVGLLAFLTLFFGNTDPFYLRFTSPKQQNLILGTSRAAQGLKPEIFHNILEKKFLNYSFTNAHTPFGPVYFESVKRKHLKKKGGTFIITIDPWSLSSWTEVPNDFKNFRENTLCVGTTSNVDTNPNLEYLYKNFRDHYEHIILSPRSKMILHQDGWLEMKGINMDSAVVAKRIQEKVDTYMTTHLPDSKFSTLRLDYLIKTIEYLKSYGEVYLVRLPVHKDIMTIDNLLIPDFDNIVKSAIKKSDGYLDLTSLNDSFIYTDGNHLVSKSGTEVSTIVANWIAEKK